jgi:hypothetical protein
MKTKLEKFALTYAILFWLAGNADAQTIFVASNGNDVSGNGSSSSPFATIQKAVDTAPTSNSTVVILPGNYSGSGNYNVNLDGKTLKIESQQGPSATIINCQRNQAFFAHSTETPNTIIEGLTITNGYVTSGADWDGQGIIDVQGTAGLTIRNCIFAQNETLATYVTTTTGIVIQHGNNGVPVVLDHCLFYENTIGGGGWTPSAGGAAVVIGTCGAGAGIYVINVINCTIVSNTLYSSVADWSPGYGGGKRLPISSGGFVLNTIVWGNSPSHAPDGVPGATNFTIATSSVSYTLADGLCNNAGVGMQNTDPLFANPATGDYSLEANSPARNAGDPTSPPNPDGSRANLGAIPFAVDFPIINLVKAVTVNFVGLSVGTNYQLQVSSDLNSWTNFGAPFTATNSFMTYSNYWNVSDWNQLFFRLH